MKVVFLIHNAYGIGGTIRSTLNLATALADRHQVEIVSVNRPVARPELTMDPRIALTPLIEMREGRAEQDARAATPSEIFRDERIDNGRLAATALTDERVGTFLARTDADVVIATRPKLIGYLAAYGHRGRYLRLGQEHLTHEAHTPAFHAVMDPSIAALDAFVTVSEADALHYRQALPGAAARIRCIPNAVPAPVAEPATGASATIVAAGRLVAVKRYDRLLAAFAKVAAERPEWRLRIYGRGPAKAALRRQIDELGLAGRVLLMGAVSPIETEWAKGAVAAVASDAESFGMTIVEAMHAGLPVVATDCPYGPREIITDGVDGLLVPLGEADGIDAYADALLRITGDAALRARLGATARETARRYEPESIAARYEALIGEVRRRPWPGGLRRRVRTVSPPAAPPARGTVRGPRAHCLVDADGSLAVRLYADELAPGCDHLLLLRRGPDPLEVRVPLPAWRGADLRVTATLIRSGRTLPEGRWDTYAECAEDGTRRRLRAELIEQQRLLTLPLGARQRGVDAWIPYRTSEGYLAVRTWLRPAHAEIEELRAGATGIDMTLALHGTHAGPGAELLLRCRERPAADFALPVVEVGAGGGTVLAGVAHPDLLTRRGEGGVDLWDVWLRPRQGAQPVRAGRIAGDIADRKAVDSRPAALHGGIRLRPFFTVSNDLTVKVHDRT